MPKEYEKIGRVSNVSVLKGSGKSWGAWIQILDRARAQSWEHKSLVGFLRERYKLGPWWQQAVAHGYLVFHGKKVDGRTSRGEFTITVTKSFPVSAVKLWQTLTSEEGFAVWLGVPDFKLEPKAPYENTEGVFGEIRTFLKNRRVRFTWQEGDSDEKSIVQVQLVARATGRSILVFQHEKLKDGRRRDPLRAHWRKVVERLHRLATIENSQKRFKKNQ